MFIHGVERGRGVFPRILTQVRLTILNKDGRDLPLAKRLIALQSVFTRAYTELRFRQLQAWSQKFFPVQLAGGIKKSFYAGRTYGPSASD